MTSDLKSIYQSITIDQTESALLAFGEKWNTKYPVISHSWTNHWQNIVTLFAFPPEIRKIIYTTNAIESLNSVIRKPINNRLHKYKIMICI